MRTPNQDLKPDGKSRTALPLLHSEKEDYRPRSELRMKNLFSIERTLWLELLPRGTRAGTLGKTFACELLKKDASHRRLFHQLT
jgi:hypothetical protein